MKKSILIAASLLAFNLTPVFSQPNPNGTPPPADNYQQRLQAIINAANPPQKPPPELTKFNLDFPGGTPKELVAAIEKATGRPLNAIIPDEDANMKLPPLKLNEITFSQLSDTMRAGSDKQVFLPWRDQNNLPRFQEFQTFYYFRKADNQTTSDDSVWFFYAQKAPTMPPVEKVCQFYPLALYLSRGFTVDDITTAIQTGWKMAGETATPELNYHKETKLLLAYGEPNKLKTIEQVLNALPQTKEDYNGLWNQVSQLQKQVDQLNKQLNPPPPASASPTSPAEKSGK